MSPKSDARHTAHGRLLVAVADMAEHGEIVPCLNRQRSHLWTSDDPAEQQAAALGCTDCPALEACRQYVSALPEPAGVWAGTTVTDRSRTARKRTNNA